MQPVLCPQVRPVFRAVVTTVVPEAQSLAEPDWAELEALVEGALRHRAPALKRQLRLLLRIIEWRGLLSGGRFSRLDAARRARLLGRLEEHPLRLVRAGFWGLRTLALLGYYGRPAAAQQIGYRPDPRGWEAIPA